MFVSSVLSVSILVMCPYSLVLSVECGMWLGLVSNSDTFCSKIDASSYIRKRNQSPFTQSSLNSVLFHVASISRTTRLLKFLDTCCLFFFICLFYWIYSFFSSHLVCFALTLLLLWAGQRMGGVHKGERKQARWWPTTDVQRVIKDVKVSCRDGVMALLWWWWGEVRWSLRLGVWRGRVSSGHYSATVMVVLSHTEWGISYFFIFLIKLLMKWWI